MMTWYEAESLEEWREKKAPLARLRALVGRLRGRPVPILEETHA
jgi:hypothetical protein